MLKQCFQYIIFSNLYVFVAISIFGSYSYGTQNHTVRQVIQGKQVKHQTSDPNNSILKYKKFLMEEAKEHRIFLESFFNKIVWVIGGLGSLIAVIVGWFNWKTFGAIRKQTAELFKEKTDDLIEQHKKELSSNIQYLSQKSEDRFSESERKLDEVVNQLRQKLKNDVVSLNEWLIELGDQADYTKHVTGKRKLRLSGKRVLWVDDYPEKNINEKQILEDQGVEFQIAISTQEAISFIKKEGNFHLIISNMERGDDKRAGIDLIKKIRSFNSELFIIIYAANAVMHKDKETAKGLGVSIVTSSSSAILRSVQKNLKRIMTDEEYQR